MVNFNPSDLPDEGADESPIAMALSIILFFVMLFWLASPASPLAQFLGPRRNDLDHLVRSFGFMLIVIVPLAVMGLVMKMVSPEEEYKKAAIFAQQSIGKFLVSFNEKTEAAKRRAAGIERTAENIPEYLESAADFAQRKAREKAAKAYRYGVEKKKEVEREGERRGAVYVGKAKERGAEFKLPRTRARVRGYAQRKGAAFKRRISEFELPRTRQRYGEYKKRKAKALRERAAEFGLPRTSRRVRGRINKYVARRLRKKGKKQ